MDKEKIRNSLSQIHHNLNIIREELEDGDDFDYEIGEIEIMESDISDLAETLGFAEDEF